MTLSVVLTGDEPPTEFRLFAAGTVETTKGSFVFDDAAAAAVMAEYLAHGIDLMIDYDHASLASVTLDPAQTGKAAGWFNLELRAGELWAVNVRWTEQAASALRAKEWRFMSPAFSSDDKGHITRVLNVAITNIPATRRLEPLMAASVTALGEKAMTLEEFMKVCKALGCDPSMLLEDCLAKIKGEKPAEKEAPEEPAEPPPAEMAVDPEAEKPEEVAAALSAIQSLSGKASFVASVADIRTWHASHVALAAETKKLADREAVLESAERRKLCVELVTLAGRVPATVWADDKASAPKAYLAAMPIAALRAMHADEIKASGKRPAVKPPVAGVTGETKTFTVNLDGRSVDVTLDARELQIAADAKCEPKTFAMLKARRAPTAA